MLAMKWGYKTTKFDLDQVKLLLSFGNSLVCIASLALFSDQIADSRQHMLLVAARSNLYLLFLSILECAEFRALAAGFRLEI